MEVETNYCEVIQDKIFHLTTSNQLAFDVVSLAHQGIRYAVATLGTATTTSHLGKLFRTCKDIVFCFDGDMGF